MKKFYVLTIIVFLTYSTKAQNWWDNHFVIGMMFDPPMRSTTSASSQYQQAINAGFNLFTGMYEDHANVDTKAIYADMVSLNNVRRHFRSKTKEKSNFPWFFAR